MTSFLLFTLYAPLASWGEITVGENRGSWDRPSRSAILGLVAAALGISREDQEAHDALDQALGVAVRLDSAGVSMTDFHTVQTAAESEIRKQFGKSRPGTRKELLSVEYRQTMVTRRELRQDSLTTAALWTTCVDPRWSLEAVSKALAQPTFVLYAGRKANVLGLPLAPSLEITETLAEAFSRRALPNAGVPFELLKPRSTEWGREVAHDALPLGVSSGLGPVRLETRRDTQAHRGRWQFAERVVSVGVLPEVTSK